MPVQERDGAGKTCPKIMLIGERHSGKSTLVRILTGLDDYVPRKVFALEYVRNIVDTPSEYLENRRFYRSLITTSGMCDILLFVQDATRPSCQMAPGFAAMFNRRIVGLITKCDLPGANVSLARRFLTNAGVRDILEVNLKDPRDAVRLRRHIFGEEGDGSL